MNRERESKKLWSVSVCGCVGGINALRAVNKRFAAKQTHCVL